MLIPRSIRKKQLEEGRMDSGSTTFSMTLSSIWPLDKRGNNLPAYGLRFMPDESSAFYENGLPAMPLAGDVIGIFPENNPDHIVALSSLLKENKAPKIKMKGSYENDNGRFYTYDEALKHVSLTPVSIELLETIKERIKNSSEFGGFISAENKDKLDRILEMYDNDRDKVTDILQHTNALDVLAAFPRLFTLQDLCELQGAINRRVYTISEIERDDKGNPRFIELRIASGISYVVPDESFGAGKQYDGVSTSFIRRLAENKSKSKILPHLEGFVQRRAFGCTSKERQFWPRNGKTPPKDFQERLSMPILAVVGGVGVSGVMALLKERQDWKSQGYDVGKVSVLMGIRSCEIDDLNCKDLQRYKELGLIENLEFVESRPNIGKGRYVQHALLEGTFQKELSELFEKKRGLLVCGDGLMGDTVVDGVLPILVPRIAPDKIPSMLRSKVKSTDFGDLASVLKAGEKFVYNLSDEGFIFQSHSTSRHKIPDQIKPIDVYQDLVGNLKQSQSFTRN